MATGKYFDDLEVGERNVTMARTITEPDLVTWSHLIGLTEEQFVNREVARQGPFGQPIIPAPLTLGFASSLWAYTGILAGTTVAVMGFQIRLLAPLFIGDTIHVEGEVSNKKRTASRPDRGVVTFLFTVLNQHDRPVMTYNMTIMMKRRPELVEADE